MQVTVELADYNGTMRPTATVKRFLRPTRRYACLSVGVLAARWIDVKTGEDVDFRSSLMHQLNNAGVAWQIRTGA